MSKHNKSFSAGLPVIAQNKKAFHDFFIEQRFEAGLVLQGWEVKSIRQSRVQLKESYAIIKDGEIWLLGAHISPLLSASTHIKTDAVRTRKLLLHKKEIEKLIGAVERKGYTLIPLCIYLKHGLIKCELALAKGKHLHDVRASSKERDWKRQQHRLLKENR